MLVVEFHVDSPILRRALARAPDTEVAYEQQYQTEDGIVLLFWAAGSDLEGFAEGLPDDPTVTNEARLAETQERRLYRATFTDYGERVATFPSWRELDASLLDSTGSSDGWDIRMRVPDRAALVAYREACTIAGIDFRLDAVYEATDSRPSDRLTNAQRETLLAARELGYFSVPREATLADVAEHCGVSSQAASERIRRGTESLVDIAL